MDEPLWMECVPILCLDIVEVHVPDRVMRQLPVIPSWGTNHHVHDRHKRLGSEVLEMLDKYFPDWGNRHQSLAVEVDDGTSEAEYRLWYMRYGRLLIVTERHNLSFTYGEEYIRNGLSGQYFLPPSGLNCPE
ncbi:uncharacterized protein LOC114075281 [Solanum pennellii]|uniref:Uncharacterized protein LOC114075281 n=1 Tax=Solanum pennellii TaxID=28526 RepID=A0ABM1V1F4_SOLPN|nr:uncharacterized protein LOC114075281 [Solanum pennellii]